MPLAERIERHRAMMSVLRKSDINAWTERFVGALEAVKERRAADG
jgi:trehalose-6-phosphate synthase